MQKMILFAIRDQKASYFAPPFTKPSRGEAERDFEMLVKDDKSVVSKYPQDFDLYEIGEYDCDAGKIVPHEAPRHMLSAFSVTNR